jgi:hypothetical protein
MKKLFILIIAILIVLSCDQDNSIVSPVSLQKSSIPIIYLSEKGNDNNSGTINKPVRNLKKAIELADGVSDIYATIGTYFTSRASLKTSLYGGWNYDFTERNPDCKTEIIGTGEWGDPLPTIQIIDASNLVIDGVTIKIGESANFRPCGIYFNNCDSTVVLQNCKIYGQLSGDAKGMSAVYIYEASPKILNNFIYGGNLQIDVNAINGIYCQYSKSIIKDNYIHAGKNKGCLHGIYTSYSNCTIKRNIIYGGESSIDCYSCAIRTGIAIESWDDSGSEDLIENNELYGGIGKRTYAIICSQDSRLKIYNNLLDGGFGEIVSMGVYIKTNDKPKIIGNTFQNCYYGTYEWNIGDYCPGETSNCQCIRNNFYRSSVQIFAHWYDEIEYREHNVSNLSALVQTEEGFRSLAYWGNMSILKIETIRIEKQEEYN